MKTASEEIAVSGIRSLVWLGESLIDWVGGGRVIHLDGTVEEPRVRYAYRFDAAVSSPCGRYVVIYEKLGTKGLVLSSGKILREVNRSFYHASAYEYPISIFQIASGQTVLAHCPNGYNEIELEDIETGKPLYKSRKREPGDFFQSRLRASSDGKWLLSAGWVWHPWQTIALFDIEAALRDPRALDKTVPIPDIDGEVVSAEFLTDDRILLATGDESLDADEADESSLAPSSLAVFEPGQLDVLCSTVASERVGTVMPVDEGAAVGFYGHPKLYSMRTGEVLKRWESIASGHQAGSILLALDDDIPPIALDPDKQRFAVASKSAISLVQV